MNELLILGVDPGTTTAYALLDLNGSLKKLKSSKGLTLGKLIKEVSEEGKIIAVGTDVKYNPKFVEKVCGILGAKMISPGKDLKAGFKERITSKFKYRDDHQRDALASAILAYKNVKEMFDKIDSHLKDVAKEHLSDDVKLHVMKGLSITDALSRVEKKNIIPFKKKKIRLRTSKSLRIFEENQKLKDDNKLLSQKIFSLGNILEETKREINKIVDKKVEKKMYIKNKNVNSLLIELNSAKKDIESLKNNINKLNNALLNSKDSVSVRKFEDLNYDSIKDGINDGDVIFANNPAVYSERSLDLIRKKGASVVYQEEISKYLKDTDISFIPLKELSCEDFGNFLLVKKRDIEKNLGNKEVLAKIIKEYKEKRKII